MSAAEMIAGVTRKIGELFPRSIALMEFGVGDPEATYRSSVAVFASGRGAFGNSPHPDIHTIAIAASRNGCIGLFPG